MANILHIETSTNVCSVALSSNGKEIFQKTNTEGALHSSLLGVFVDEAIHFAQTQAFKPQAVALSEGPGSYTGLRIGTSMAKGLCMGWDIPLIALPTLKIMAYKVVNHIINDSEALYCSMLDARRMEVYSAVYNHSLDCVRDIEAEIITEKSYEELLYDKNIFFFGNGAQKCKPMITSANAHFIDDICPLASDMIQLAEKAYEANNFADRAYFEPFYLKDFVAIQAKNKVLGNLI